MGAKIAQMAQSGKQRLGERLKNQGGTSVISQKNAGN
jgi:hypothetical protein